MVKERGKSLPKAVRAALADDHQDVAEEMMDIVNAFYSSMNKKHGSKKAFMEAMRQTLYDCAVYPDAERAPRLVLRNTPKPCVITGEVVSTVLITYIDRRVAFEHACKNAKERDEEPPTWDDETPPQRFGIPVRADRAGLVIHMVLVGSVRLAYNPLLGSVDPDEYATAVLSAMADLAAL